MAKDKLEFYKDKADEFRWRRVAPNGDIVGASTEGYKNQADCKENAERLQTPAQPAPPLKEFPKGSKA